MQLNPDSFFIKKFLQYSHHDLPDTICQLGRRILLCSILWTSVLALAIIAVVSLLVSAFGLLVVAFTDATILSWFGEVFKENASMSFYGLCLYFSFILASGACILSVVVGIPYAITAFKDHRRDKQREAYYAARERGEEYVAPPTPVADFFSGLYKRFKDKTCVMITFKRKNDEPTEPDFEW